MTKQVLQRIRRRLARKNEAGFALITVMLASMMLGLLALALIGYAMGSQNISRHDQNWNASLAAAEGGIDDYIFRLNENANYWLYNAGNPPPDGNTAFSAYTQIAGNPTDANYKYAIDASTINSDGRVRITSTGEYNNVKRSVYATLRRKSFLDFLYFTDFETKDPQLYTGSPFTVAEAQTECAMYYYAGRDSQCTDIRFITADAINGPLHSNDAFMVCGSPDFNDATTTSWNGASGLKYRTDSSGSCSPNSPDFANAGDPRTVPKLQMPPTNSSLKTQVAAGTGGCLYTGPTRIRLLSNGQMTVNSPFSKQTNNGCVTNGTGAQPTNGVIFVQNVPSSTSDANYTNGCPYNVNGRSHPLGMPIANDVTSYGCRNGDVFIEGTLKGQLTVSAENNITITWDLTYNGGLGGTDLLGLIANNYVQLWHPVQCTSGSSSSCNLNANFPGETARGSAQTDPDIMAAMLSLQHSVWVQNYNIGAPLGTLEINGAIAQKYRGAVGTSSGGTPVTGYAKGYTYDQRLKYSSPPKFLDPVASQWQIASWAEIKTPSGF